MSRAAIDSRPVARSLSREAVVAAARDILVAEGLGGVSLRRVAAALGVTAPALYAHVTDKRDLLQSIADGEYERMIAAFEAVRDDDPIQAVRGRSMAYIAYAKENPALFTALFLSRPELMNDPREGGASLAAKAFETGAAPVFAAIESGMFRAGDPSLAAMTMWAAVHGVTTIILTGPAVLDPHDEERLAESVIDTMIRGFRPD